MFKNYQFFLKSLLSKTSISLFFFLFWTVKFCHSETTDAKKYPILQASIQIQPVQPISGDSTGKIQPGTALKIMAYIENKGSVASPAGEFYINYGFAPPLEKGAKSIIFETEKKALPSIDPGKTVEIQLEAQHQIPSLLDFIRYDWTLREYQAIAVINKKEHLIGTLALTFSAYYYPGIRKEFPKKIPADE